jgi:hypothetical protein
MKKTMKKHFKAVCAIWGAFWLAELWMAAVMVGFFTNGMTFLCHLSYLFGFGYFLTEFVGNGVVGPMYLSDWRWIAGTLAMLVASLPPVLARGRAARVAGYIVFIAIHVVSFWCLMFNMVGAIT